MGAEIFRFDGRNALVVGGATGMGSAAVTLLHDLGASVTIADIAKPAGDAEAYVQVDLCNRASIDALVDGLTSPIHVVLSCAGVADGTPGLPFVNFIGHRHVIERAIDRALLPEGAAVGMIASIGGMAWQKHLDDVLPFLDTVGYDEAAAWIDARPELATYAFSKQAMIAYCARRAPALSPAGIRINCVAPGPTMTPLLDATASWQGFAQQFELIMGRPGATPEQQAYPLVFLVSEAASYVSGTCLVVDGGFMSGGLVGAIESPSFDYLLS